jgi:C1A family cysteine protease
MIRFCFAVLALAASLALAEESFPPAHFDLREELGGLPPVKNQGNCGSAIAFAGATALEVAIKMKEGFAPDLSEQQIISCDTTHFGCAGGTLNFDYLVKTGLALASEFPYIGQNAGCKASLHAFRHASDWGKIRPEPGTWMPSDTALKWAITKYGAIPVGIFMSRRLSAYPGGIYDCDDDDGSVANHMVNLVGWDETGKVRYWIARNSWGERWGEQGYFRIKFGCNNIGSNATYIEYHPEATSVIDWLKSRRSVPERETVRR